MTLTVAACGDEPEDASTHSGTTDAEPWQIAWEFPDAPQVGENALLLTITDDGHGAWGLDVTVEPWMPHHGHGSPETPVVTEGTGGDCTVENLYFTMGGPWEVRIELADGEVEGDGVDGVIEVDVPVRRYVMMAQNFGRCEPRRRDGESTVKLKMSFNSLLILKIVFI